MRDFTAALDYRLVDLINDDLPAYDAPADETAASDPGPIPYELTTAGLHAASLED